MPRLQFLCRLAVAVAFVHEGLAAQEPVSKPSLVPPAGGNELIDAVAAKVNNTVITKSEVERAIGKGLDRLSPENRQETFARKLRELAIEALEEEAVREVGVAVPPKYVKERIEAQ